MLHTLSSFFRTFLLVRASPAPSSENCPNMNMFHVGSPSYENRLGLSPRSFFHFEKERETEIAGEGGGGGGEEWVKNLQDFRQQTRADRREG